MLIYLDTAHFDYIEKATTAERARFLAAWSSTGCELALSLHHFQEFAQLADQTSFQRRLGVLRLFQSIRCRPATSELVRRFEAQVQLLKLLGASVDLRRSAIDSFFPPTTFEAVEASLSVARPYLKSMRVPLQMGAEASNLTKGQQRTSLKRRLPPDEEARAHARQLAREALTGHPPEVAAMMMSIFDRVEAEVARAGSPRAALEHIYGLDEVAARSRFPDSDLAALEAIFRVSREEASVVAAKCGIPCEDVLHLVNDLNPYACPSFALQLATRRARERHSKPDEPGDEIDVDHVAFAPYVDHLFVDKRTDTFILQEARSSSGFLDPGFAANIHRVGTLTVLERQLADFAGVKPEREDY